VPDTQHDGLIERHSIEPVPLSERKSGFADTFRMMFALNLNPLIYVLGALAVIRGGLPVWWAAAAIALGQLIAYAVLGIVAWTGVDYGIPGQIALRATLGQQGARGLSSPYRLVVSTYLFAAQALAASYAIQALVEPITGKELPLVPTAFVLALVEVVVAISGFEAFQRLSRIAFPVMIAYTGVVLILYLNASDSSFGTSHGSAGENLRFQWVAFATFVTVMASGALSFVTNIGDLCRYSRSRRDVFWSLVCGSVSATFLASWVGAYAAAKTGNLNPYVAVGLLTSNAVLLGALLMALLLQAVSVSVANVYTAGLSVANVLPRLSRWACTVFAGIPSILLTLTPSIVSHAEHWMREIGIVAAPLAGVVLADLVLRRFALDVDELLGRSERETYQRGLNRSAVVAIALGAVVYVAVPESFIKAVWGVGVSVLAYVALSHASGSTATQAFATSNRRSDL
jgi:nucleobase:cation symporter-1, NCS1 family